MQVHLTMRSSNAKTGPIPVSTTERASCWQGCAFYGAGCYAEAGPLRLHWDKVSAHVRGYDWAAFLREVSAMPAGTFWRHNQAGDLPGEGAVIDSAALRSLVDANVGKRGFTYTHKPMDDPANRAAVADANARGFTINLSANNLAHADELAALNVGPVAVVVPIDYPREGTTTPDGRPVRTCPATYRDDVSCDTCRACANADRNVIIAFPAHGTGKAKAQAATLTYRGRALA